MKATKRFTNENTPKEDNRQFTNEEAKIIGNVLGTKWNKFDVDQFRKGINVELERGKRNIYSNIYDDDPRNTGRIALAHLNESSDYYDRYYVMEKEVIRN